MLLLLFSGAITGFACFGGNETVFEVIPETAQEGASSERLSLPHPVAGTSLVAEQLVLYEGADLENGTAEVIQVAALMLRNTAQWGVERAVVTLQSENECYIFEAEDIPPGDAVLVLEKNRSAFCPQTFTACFGASVGKEENWDYSQMLDVEYLDIKTVTVTNQTDRVLGEIVIHYKNYIEDPEIYVGGNSRIYLIERLEPGQTIYIYPSFYAKGYSRFARIEIREIL